MSDDDQGITCVVADDCAGILCGADADASAPICSVGGQCEVSIMSVNLTVGIYLCVSGREDAFRVRRAVVAVLLPVV